MQIIIDLPEDVLKRTVFYREFKDLNDCIETIKALEKATPLDGVKRGKWIKADSQQYFRKHYPAFTCSECGQRKDSQKKWNYCPNCGARMDKE